MGTGFDLIISMLAQALFGRRKDEKYEKDLEALSDARLTAWFEFTLVLEIFMGGKAQQWNLFAICFF